MPDKFTSRSPQRSTRGLYVQVLIAVILGIGVGYLFPEWGRALKPLGDGFIKLVKMMIAPIVFCTVAQGIAALGDIKRVGRVGIRTLIYFEVVSTAALIIGLVVVNVLKPGVGLTPSGETFSAANAAIEASQDYLARAHHLSGTEFILNIIPTTFFSALVSGELLQVLFIAALTGFGVLLLGERRAQVISALEVASELFFKIMSLLVRFAPLGAFGAMAFTVGSFGLGTLHKLALLMGGFYITALLFVLVVLGMIARAAGFSIIQFIRYIKDELWLVLGTSSSESALPSMLDKLIHLGAARSTVGLVLPLGYSFNLDGTNIYMTMAVVFLAQATNTPLDLSQQITLMLVAMLTSKGASGVTGAGFVILAATLQAVPGIPLESLALLLGIDRFMSECRALTNLIGNGVATLVVSRWEGELSPAQLQSNLSSSL